MSTEVATISSMDGDVVATESFTEYATAEVNGQLIGIPVLEVQDILNPMEVTEVPLSNQEISGLLNLRGRIVTVVDMRKKLGVDSFENPNKQMSIVVEQDEELFSLLVDQIRDVMNLPKSTYEDCPPNLDPQWAEYTRGVHRLESQIIVILDVNKLLDYSKESPSNGQFG